MEPKVREFLNDTQRRAGIMAESLRDNPSKRTRESLADWLDIMQSQARNLLDSNGMHLTAK